MKILLLGLLMSFNTFAVMMDQGEVIYCAGLSNHERGIESEYIMHTRLEYDSGENLVASVTDGYDQTGKMQCDLVDRGIVKCTGGQWFRGREVSVTFESRVIMGQELYAADVSNRSSISGGKRVVLPFCRKINL